MTWMQAVVRHAFPIAAFALAMGAIYPGHLSWDSAFLLWQARTGHYYNVAPAAMPILWGAIQSIWPGSGGLFTLQVALFTGGVWAIACALFSSTGLRVLATILAFLGTPAFLIVTHLWTDAIMIACLTAGCGLTVLGDLRRSRAALFSAVPLFVLGGMIRHNAAPALVPLLTWWSSIYIRQYPGHWRPPIWTLALGAIAAAGVILGFSRVIDRFFVNKPVSTFAAVQVFDLAGISVATSEMLVPDFLLPEGFTLETLRKRYVPYNNVALFLPPAGVKEVLWEWSLTESELEILRKCWGDAILAHPKEYLEHRAALTTWLFNRYRNDRPRELALSEAIAEYKGNPAIRPNDTALHQWTIRWYERMIGWWTFAPVTFLVICLSTLFLAWRTRHEPISQFALAAGTSGLAYIAPLPLVAPSAELRYSGWLFAATSFAVIALASQYAIGNFRERLNKSP